VNGGRYGKRTGFGSSFGRVERSGVGKGLGGGGGSRGPRGEGGRQSDKIEALRSFMEENVHGRNRDSQCKLESGNVDSESGMNSQDLGNGHGGVDGKCLIQFQ
jgi:hypothetical protein